MLDSFVVMEVQTGSSADQIGLRPGMLICTVDGESKDNLISFAKALHLKNSGEKIRQGYDLNFIFLIHFVFLPFVFPFQPVFHPVLSGPLILRL